MRLIKESYRTRDIHIRVPEEVRLSVEAAARERGYTITEYCEMVLAASSGYTRLEQEINIEVYKEGDRKRKTEVIPIRVTKADKSIIEAKAKVAGVSRSKYIENAALDKKIIIIDGIKDLTHEVSKIGTNLNQLAILAHQGKITSPDLFGTQDALKEILKALIKLQKSSGKKG